MECNLIKALRKTLWESSRPYKAAADCINNTHTKALEAHWEDVCASSFIKTLFIMSRLKLFSPNE